MEKVTGIGGFFFRAKDPKALGLWYQQHLGVSLIPTSYEESPWQQEAGPTAFAPFKETSDYFGDAHKVWMLNFRELLCNLAFSVRNLRLPQFDRISLRVMQAGEPAVRIRLRVNLDRDSRSL